MDNPHPGSASDQSKVENNNGHKNGHIKKKLHNWLKKKVLGKNGDHSLKSDLQEVLEEHEEQGQATPDVIRNVIHFDEIRVVDVMTPRPDIAAVQSNISFKDLKAFVAEREHTRIPVYKESKDNFLGFIHVKDLFKYWDKSSDFTIENVMRDVLFVPPSMKVINLLEKMKITRTHMALVVDEYGGIDGLVTIEDLMEELVGEIEDEHDSEISSDVRKIGDNSYEAAARVEIQKLEEILKLSIYSGDDESEFDTIGGLIFTSLGRVPKAGEGLKHPSGLEFKVIDADKRRIKRVGIVVGAPLPPNSEESVNNS